MTVSRVTAATTHRANIFDVDGIDDWSVVHIIPAPDAYKVAVVVALQSSMDGGRRCCWLARVGTVPEYTMLTRRSTRYTSSLNTTPWVANGP